MEIELHVAPVSSNVGGLCLCRPVIIVSWYLHVGCPLFGGATVVRLMVDAITPSDSLIAASC